MRKLIRNISVILSIFLFIGCLFDARGDEPGLAVLDDDDESTEGMRVDVGDLTSTTQEESSSSSSTDGGLLLDVYDPEPTSCKKIDFLFVIDNSGSMIDNQANLIANFQGFIDGIKGLVDFDDFHVGVITTDAYWFNAGLCSAMGGLVSKTGGNDSSNKECGPWVNGNFMTQDEIDDPETGFACAAQVGTQGAGSERPIQALVSSMAPFINSEGQCNHGFFRDDSKLIVVIITDEEDISSEGGVAIWLNEMEFYQGDLDDIVILGLVPLQTAMDSSCVNSYDTNRIKDFILSFNHSSLGSVCSSDYSQFFKDSLSVIESACKPVG